MNAAHENPRVYLCNHKKNNECKKTSCQKICFCTTNPKYKTNIIKEILFRLSKKGRETKWRIKSH